MEFNPHKVLSNTVGTLDTLGLPLTAKPKHEPTPFPDDISSLSPLEISKLMVEYTSWYSFAISMEAYAASETNLLKGQMDYLSAQSYITADAKTIEDRKMSKYNNEDFVKLNQEYLEADARREMLKSMSNKFDKFIWVLSRCVTVLSAEFDRGKY